MNFYIVDDDISVIKKLELIIESSDLGNIVGFNVESKKALKEIEVYKTDIVLVDLLKTKKNGIDLIKELKDKYNFSAIMISQVNNKEMIQEAYEKGIEFFISKPILKNEVIKVIENVKSKIILDNAMDIFNKDLRKNNTSLKKIKNVKLIINRLGISGEKGIVDLIKILKYIIENNITVQNVDLKTICKSVSLSYRTTCQRMRRALMKGQTNLAHQGLEDFYSDNFTRYSNTLFSFKEVRKTMNYIKGIEDKPGSVNILQFIDSLIILINKD